MEPRRIPEDDPEGQSPGSTEPGAGNDAANGLRDVGARELMTPRRDVVAVSVTARVDEAAIRAMDSGFSRLPVYGESLDQIVGVVETRALLEHAARSPAAAAATVGSVAGEAFFVPDTKRIGDLLLELHRRDLHMAVVLDEFGGTEGIITTGDILDELVDAWDNGGALPDTCFTATAGGEIVIDGSTSITEANEKLGLDLPEQDFHTVGGFVFGALGRIPESGDEVPVGGDIAFRVEDVRERRVTQVRLVRRRPKPPQGSVARRLTSGPGAQ